MTETEMRDGLDRAISLRLRLVQLECPEGVVWQQSTQETICEAMGILASAFYLGLLTTDEYMNAHGMLYHMIGHNEI